MNLLHIDTSILGPGSVSREVTAGIVERLRGTAPDLSVTYLDLAADPIAHLGTNELATLAEGRALAEFLAADVVVIGAPMYNFTVPSQLKAWLDRILVAGKTFSYDKTGVVTGLAAGKRVIIAIARGGIYSANSPFATLEHTETYLRGAFNFIGVTDVELIVAEGIQMGPDHRAAALSAARDATAALDAGLVA